jgi:hypothetical protein
LLKAVHNTNNICDDLAIDTAAKPALEQLSPLPPAGTSFYDSSAPVFAGICTAGTDAIPPNPLCTNVTALTRVIDHAVVGVTEPVIYAIKGSSTAECDGQDWVLPDAGLPNGWICLAAIAKDTVGNVGISAPLRVCLNDTSKVAPACANSSTTPPSCTDGCTVPSHFGVTLLDLPQ